MFQPVLCSCVFSTALTSVAGDRSTIGPTTESWMRSSLPVCVYRFFSSLALTLNPYFRSFSLTHFSSSHSQVSLDWQSKLPNCPVFGTFILSRALSESYIRTVLEQVSTLILLVKLCPPSAGIEWWLHLIQGNHFVTRRRWFWVNFCPCNKSYTLEPRKAAAATQYML